MLSSITSILACLATVSQAAPAPVAPNVNGATSFSAPAIHNTNFQRNGTAALLKAYAKHGLVPTKRMPEWFTTALSSSVEKRQNGQVPATPDSQGVEYLVATTVGGQTLNLDFDTGSSDLWVFSTLLAAASETGHHVYASAKSTTYKLLSGYTWKITYADGSGASGKVVTDTVKIGGTAVTGQAIELASKVSSQFVSDTSDGLVGLAFSNINTVSPVQQKTFFDNAKASLGSPLFAAYLPFNANGAYDFGFIDTAKYTGTIAYAAVDSSNGFWEFASTGYKVGSTVHTSSGYTGIADTGTTLILMGDAAVDTYYASVSGASFDSSQGGYTFPCSATLPTLSFKIGANYATIKSSLLNFGAIDGSKCFGSLQSVGSGSQNIYGDVFFNAYYGIFDSNGPRFGYAVSK